MSNHNNKILPAKTSSPLMPIVYIVAVVAALGVGAGVYTLTQGKDAVKGEMEEVNQAYDKAVDEINEEGKGTTVQQAVIEGEKENITKVEPAADSKPSDAGEPDIKKAVIEGKEVEAGNPVVAQVDGKPITRVDVFRYIQTMPENIQQLPPSTVYPMALEQVIDTRMVQNRAEAGNLENDPEVTKQMEMARQQIIRSLYIQREVDKQISESDMKKKYDEYVASVGEIEERHARHILVDSEQKAREAIEKLKGGADFTALAKEYSAGPSAEKGGDLGWFAKGDMVPAFADAAFSAPKGAFTAEPVKTQFGWHVIKVEDIRKRPPPSFEELKPVIQAELRRETVGVLVKKWRGDADITVYDINGEPMNNTAPAAGEPEKAQPAPSAAPAPAPSPAPAQLQEQKNQP